LGRRSRGIGFCGGRDVVDPNVLYAFVELGWGGLSQDLVADYADAPHERSVGVGWHGVSVVRAEAIKAFYLCFEFACMLFNWGGYSPSSGHVEGPIAAPRAQGNALEAGNSFHKPETMGLMCFKC